MPNRCFLSSDGLIHAVYEGDQTYESFHEMTLQLSGLTKQLKQEGKSVYILVDLDAVGNADDRGRHAAIEALTSLPFDKVAIYSGNVFVKHLVNFVIAVSGKASSVRYFETREEAETWLKQT